jgi:hypothetical protein
LFVAFIFKGASTQQQRQAEQEPHGVFTEVNATPERRSRRLPPTAAS